MPSTKKPCPLCKQPGLRDSEEVCPRCQDRYKELLALESAVKRSKDKKLYQHPSRSYNLPHVYLHQSTFEFRNLERFQVAMNDLILLLSEPATEKMITGDRFKYPLVIPSDSKDQALHSSNFHNLYLLIEPRVVELVRELYSVFADATAREYAMGLDDGQSLIKQLASGDLTIKQLEEKTLTKKGIK